jgi:selenocysteine lyase/cysteine desulfurase
MSFNRRLFLQKLTTLSAAMTIPNLLPEAVATSLEAATKRVAHMSAAECASDESYWYQIRQAYTVSEGLVNLNNGGVSPQPRVVQEAQERYNQLSNELPSYYMWRTLDAGREPLRKELARLAGCSSEEVAICRNTSEALSTIIMGLRLKPGDEVVLSKQDYPNMLNAWKQREHREGIVLKWVDFESTSMDDNFLAEQYNKAFTTKTKVVHITHMINWSGQILPVRKIADLAKAKGIEVVVDGAHAFAQLQFAIADLNCDYFGTSLHKWLCAPFGTGMLYVRKEKIKQLYPLLAASNPEDENIQKFEQLGTRSFATEQAIHSAIHFHEYIGAERKQKRLFYLKNYWSEQAAKLPGLRIHTPVSESHSGAICLFSIDGIDDIDVVNALFSDPWRIHVTSVKLGNLHGIRISPNVYTLTKELDRLLEAIKACLADVRGKY